VTRWARVLVLLVAGGLGALGAEIARPGSPWVGFALVGGAIAAGELIELRPPLRSGPLPLSFAYMVVLARQAPLDKALVVLALALLATFVVRTEPTEINDRLVLFAERFLAGIATVLVYRGILDALGDPRSRAAVLAALALAALAPIIVSDVAGMVRGHTLTLSPHGRSADVAVVTSAMLMAVSDRGIPGHGGMGLWGPAVFTIPLLAAWYSYERLDEIRRTYQQTIRALGAAPELGGYVRSGHAERVADLAVAVAAELGFPPAELAHLETAALLHHLGQVCIDEPDDGGAPDPSTVAAASAAILRTTSVLAPAGDVVAAEVMPYRERQGTTRPGSMSGQILKVTSEFDELSEGSAEHAGPALEALFSGPAFLYDNRVLAALETVLDRRGVLTQER